MSDDEIRELVKLYGNDEFLSRIRHGLAKETANIFDAVGKELKVLTMALKAETDSEVNTVRHKIKYSTNVSIPQ